MKLIAALLALAGTSTLLHASPIAGGSCGFTGTLAQFVSLGDAGCYLDEPSAGISSQVRIYDIAVTLPLPADLSSSWFNTSGDEGLAFVAAGSFRAGTELTLSWESQNPANGGWYQTNTLFWGSSSFASAFSGDLTLLASVPGDTLGVEWDITPTTTPLPILRSASQFATPEPSASLPLAGLALLLAARRRRMTARSCSDRNSTEA